MRIHATAAAAFALASLVALAAPRASHAQLSFGSPDQLPPVMTSKEYEALASALALDAAQRSAADAIFDDAQQRMFAIATEGAALRRPGTVGAFDAPADRRTAADREQRQRSESARLLQETNALFDALAAVARADQRDALERERFAAQRRVARTAMGGLGNPPLARTDLDSVVDGAKLPPAARDAAVRALAPYRQQLAPLFAKLLDEQLALPAKVAAKREGAAAGEGLGAQFVASMQARREASGALNGVLDQLADAHRAGMDALASALPPAESDKVRFKAYQSFWARAAGDIASPRRVFADLPRELKDADSLKAVAAARDAWLARWWNASMRLSKVEDARRGLPPGDAKAAELKEQAKELKAERAAANRDAWRALVAADPVHAEFHSTQSLASDPSTDPPPFAQAPALPVGDGQAADNGLAGGIGAAAAGEGDVTVTSTAVVMISAVSAGGDGAEPEVITFEGTDMFEGGIALQVSDDGVANILGDRFGDGLGAGGSTSIQFGNAQEPAMTGAKFPRPMQRADADRIAQQLGGRVPDAVLTQLFEDYAAKAAEAERTTADRAREALKGSAQSWNDPPEEETPIASIPRGIEALAAWDAALAAADDGFVAAVGAAAGAAPEAIARASADRAWLRVHELHYPRPPEQEFALANDPAPSVLDIIRTAQLVDADRTAALSALDTWLPGAMAAAQAVRTAERDSAADEIGRTRERMRKMQQRMREQAAAPKPAEGVAVEGFTIVRGIEDEPDAGAAGKPRGRSLQELADAARAQVAAGRDAVAAAVSDGGKASFMAAWKRALAPKAYADAKDASIRIEATLRDPSLAPATRAQVESLRTAHASAHAALDERIADAMVEQALGSAVDGDPAQVNAMMQRDQAIAEARFERAELNARTLRRLRAIAGEAAGAEPKVNMAPAAPLPAAP
jgi:hypothetical protein